MPTDSPAGTDREGVRLSEPKRRALTYIVGNPDTSPAFIGMAMMDGRETRTRRSAQGYGRIGGGMVWRLIKAGLVYNSGGGWPRYRATAKGRAALDGTAGRNEAPALSSSDL